MRTWHSAILVAQNSGMGHAPASDWYATERARGPRSCIINIDSSTRVCPAPGHKCHLHTIGITKARARAPLESADIRVARRVGWRSTGLSAPLKASLLFALSSYSSSGSFCALGAFCSLSTKAKETSECKKWRWPPRQLCRRAEECARGRLACSTASPI